MKKVLFDILNEIQPYELITVCINHDYWTLCRQDAIFPLAIDLKRIDSSFTINIQDRYLFNGLDEEIANNIIQYESDHTIEYDNKKFVIEREILSIEYEDDYIKLSVQSEDGILTNYINYNSIDYIRLKTSAADNLLEKYNELQYMIANNK